MLETLSLANMNVHVLKYLLSTSTQVPIHKLSKSIDLFSHKNSTYTKHKNEKMKNVSRNIHVVAFLSNVHIHSHMF